MTPTSPAQYPAPRRPELRQRVAQVERLDLGGAVEEPPVDALERRPVALVGLLDRELALGERVAGHLDPAEAARALGEQEHVEVDLGAEDLVEAAEEALTGGGVFVGVEEAAAHLHAGAGL